VFDYLWYARCGVVVPVVALMLFFCQINPVNFFDFFLIIYLGDFMNSVKGVTRTIDEAELKCVDCNFDVVWGTTKLDSLKRSARRHAEKTGHTVKVLYSREFTITKI